ncbi:M4 family metallopeptidase [Sphingomonas psychrolutea]|uniref:Neutral metalloproteinase n=1 Tax=Sphingomonas psychrolutea TaxID=1259676 RepID=A0ABQ1G0K8_9SPHN|nr:M4 family metallopeptidase [Sphingomonas psychrolutea]GGA34373.1 bacillolysin [Sphingomonas psychrolutea]
MAITDAPGNGLKSFSLHAGDVAEQPTFAALAAERDTLPAFSAAALATAAVDPETAARRYLDQALDSDSAPAFTAPASNTGTSRFKVVGTETVPLTGTKTVKFRQTLHDIPVYGSLVTVELDDDNALVSLNSALGAPTDITPVAKISPAEAAAAVEAKPPYEKLLTDIAPRLTYYFEAARSKWRLAFIFEDVPVTAPKTPGTKVEPVAPRYFDYVVDAQTARVIAELPRTPSMASQVQQAPDAHNVVRDIRVEAVAGRTILRDTVYNITTYDFGFGDPTVNDSALPGSEVSPVFPQAAVSAHANAAAVASFLREVVQRNNIDDRGGAMDSSVNCVVQNESPGNQIWLNAYWNGRQMVYGQIRVGNGLLTLAAALDIVGHEMFHGVTDHTSRLEYAGQSGALNESYSDIFGVIIANRGKPDPRTWNWLMGDGYDNGKPFRDMANPPSRGQPDHVRDFKVLPNTRRGDWGGVHTNSGIHNKAAYIVLTAADQNGLVFTPEDVAAVFYVAVTQLLSRTSQFGDSRRYAVSAARSLFRRSSPAELQRKIAALEAAFTSVGIV